MNSRNKKPPFQVVLIFYRHRSEMRPILDSFIERAKEIRMLRQHLEEAKEIQKRMEIFDSVDIKNKILSF